MDRVNYDNHNDGVRPRDYQKTRLVSIFERLSKEVTDTSKRSEFHEYCYPLKVQGPESLFPIKKADYPAGDSAESEYDSLFTQFMAERIDKRKTLKKARWLVLQNRLDLDIFRYASNSDMKRTISTWLLHLRIYAAFDSVRFIICQNVDICSCFWSKKSSKKPVLFNGIG
jgi:hypothetical protein